MSAPRGVAVRPRLGTPPEPVEGQCRRCKRRAIRTCAVRHWASGRWYASRLCERCTLHLLTVAWQPDQFTHVDGWSIADLRQARRSFL